MSINSYRHLYKHLYTRLYRDLSANGHPHRRSRVCDPSGKQRQSGVVLLAVLVLMIIVTMLVSTASQLLNRNIELAQRAKISLEDAAAVRAMAAKLSYILAVQRLTNAGISAGTNIQAYETDEDGFFVLETTGDEIRIDGFWYFDQQTNVEYKIQSNSGLIGINSRDQIWIRKWLETTDLSMLAVNQLLDSLADYADENDDLRAAGAERDQDYPPLNYLLQRCEQLYSVKHWGLFLAKHPAFLADCSTRRTASLNVNTMPVALWNRLMPTSVDKLNEQRNAGVWFARSQDAVFVEPSLQNISDEYFAVKGEEGYRITVRRNNTVVTHSLEIGTGGGQPVIEL